jgi:hypothetical protein
MSIIIRDNKGNPVIEIDDWVVAKPTIDGKIQPYGAHWVTRADEPAKGEGFLCTADKLVKLLNDFYDKEF